MLLCLSFRALADETESKHVANELLKVKQKPHERTNAWASINSVECLCLLCASVTGPLKQQPFNSFIAKQWMVCWYDGEICGQTSLNRNLLTGSKCRTHQSIQVISGYCTRKGKRNTWNPWLDSNPGQHCIKLCRLINE